MDVAKRPEKCQRVCKPGSVHPLRGCAAIPLGDGSLRPSSNQPGRRARNRPICRPYSVLLPVGFAVPLPLPAARCALTAPFHLRRAETRCDLLSVALSLGSPPPAVTRHRRSVEPGLSSPRLREPRPPDPLALAYVACPRSRSKRSCARAEQKRAGSPGIRRRSSPSISSGRKRRWKATDRRLSGRARHSRSARARAGSRRRSSADRSGPWSAAAQRGRAAPAAPSRTARPDPACAPGRRRNGRRRWPAGSGGAATMSASSGISASICCSGKGR